MFLRIVISAVVAAIVGWIAILVMSIGNYLKALIEVAEGSFCFFVSPLSMSVSVVIGMIAFGIMLYVLWRR